jgi:succinate dehydrogenase/fumarate reductase cytochrome b subunit
MKKLSLAVSAFIGSFFVFTLSLYAATAAELQATEGISTLGNIITAFTSSIVKAVGTLLLASAVVAFFYGIVEYIWGQREGKSDKVTNGRQFMLWGLIALFVMFSVYGIIKFGQGIFFKDIDVNKITIPEINFKMSSQNNPNTTQTGAATANSQNTGLFPNIIKQNSSNNQNNGVFPNQNTRKAPDMVGSTAVGADCTVLGSTQECGGTLVCVNYQCQRQTANTTSGSGANSSDQYWLGPEPSNTLPSGGPTGNEWDSFVTPPSSGPSDTGGTPLDCVNADGSPCQ